MISRFAPRPIDVADARAAFENSRPFRHVVIDDFFAREAALALHAAFPRFSRVETFKARMFSGRVYGRPPDGPGAVFREANAAIASRAFARTLAAITGIDPLAMDETQDGAGAHIGLRGSALPVHADHNTHPRAPWLYRRLNLLIYVNPNWRPAWRSNLLLYDATGTRKVAEVEPRFNRAILMDVHDRAFHGYRPLHVPYGESRQMLASYFYAMQPSEYQTAEPHASIFGSPRDVRASARGVTRIKRTILHYVPALEPLPSWERPGPGGSRSSGRET